MGKIEFVAIVVLISCRLPTGSCRPINPVPANAPISVQLRNLGNYIWLYVFDSTLKNELFAQSTGSHSKESFLSSDPAVDAANHAVAGAIVELWSDLRTMEPARRLYSAVLQKIAGSEGIGINQPMETYVSMLDDAYGQDAVVGGRYARLKDEMKTRISVAEDHVTREKTVGEVERDERNANNVSIRILNVNEAFVGALAKGKDDDEEAGEGAQKRHVFAKSVVDLAESADMYGRLQKLYDETLSEVAASTKFDEFPSDDVTSSLFSTLEKKIASNAEISAAFEDRKRKNLSNAT